MTLRGRAGEESAVALLDEAVRVVRHAPASFIAMFYIGSLPFVLAFLRFWTDMRQNPEAGDRLGSTALGLALLYVWMKAWQATFAEGLRAHLSGEGDEQHGWRSRPARVERRVLAQAAGQPWSLLVLPLALVVAVPFGWTYAYYQSLSVTGDPAEARRHAAARPGQNHLLVALLGLAGLLVFANVLAGLILMPSLLRSFLGVGTALSLDPTTMMNSTTYLIALGITYLLVSPVSRAAYVLRCFREDSLRTGEDLLREVRRLPPVPATAIVLLAALLAGEGQGAIHAATGGGAAAPLERGANTGAVPAAALDAALRRVLDRPEFRWRARHASPAVDDGGFLVRLLRSIGETLGRWTDAVVDVFERFGRWLSERFGSGSAAAPIETPSTGWMTSLPWLLGILLALTGASAALLLWRARVRNPATALAVAASPTPDLHDDGLAAAGATSQEWRDRAREFAAQGDLRLATRAHYLGCLAILAESRLIAPERAKSNRDYLREVRRRSPDRPHVAALFENCTGVFERVWYGRHAATEALVDDLGRAWEALRMQAGRT